MRTSVLFIGATGLVLSSCSNILDVDEFGERPGEATTTSEGSGGNDSDGGAGPLGGGGAGGGAVGPGGRHLWSHGFGSIEERMRLHGLGVIHGGANSLRYTPHFAIDSDEIDLIVAGTGEAIRAVR